jgi:hypothetical protein
MKQSIIIVLFTAGIATGQTVLDGGFESYAISPGGFVQPTSGPWTFGNDAGVVEPLSPNSSTGPLHTWSATRAAFAGQQYASTYAGGDTIRQSVTFSSPGVYELSVLAFSPDGTLTIPGVFANQPLTNGEFRFWFDGGFAGPTWTVPAGQDWAKYSVTISVAQSGAHAVGVGNTLTDRYFINYDAFQVEPIPEPTMAALQAMILMGFCARRRTKERDDG